MNLIGGIIETNTPTLQAHLDEIARIRLSQHTLGPEGSDALDFLEVSKWGLRDLMTVAYLMGRADQLQGH
ncbi:DUF6900 domain-containing protein [Rothia sp. P5764]|uniref:DUF6900 domain-containing protein n=1 Tax=Rothia sp. P5764 TaxID=3402654 RepID=UPI003AD05112